jgi:hypothetical protein
MTGAGTDSFSERESVSDEKTDIIAKDIVFALDTSGRWQVINREREARVELLREESQ